MAPPGASFHQRGGPKLELLAGYSPHALLNCLPTLPHAHLPPVSFSDSCGWGALSLHFLHTQSPPPATITNLYSTTNVHSPCQWRPLSIPPWLVCHPSDLSSHLLLMQSVKNYHKYWMNWTLIKKIFTDMNPPSVCQHGGNSHGTDHKASQCVKVSRHRHSHAGMGGKIGTVILEDIQPYLLKV